MPLIPFILSWRRHNIKGWGAQESLRQSQPREPDRARLADDEHVRTRISLPPPGRTSNIGVVGIVWRIHPIGFLSVFQCIRPADRAVWVRRATLLTASFFHERLSITADVLLAETQQHGDLLSRLTLVPMSASAAIRRFVGGGGPTVIGEHDGAHRAD
jgi:hypothetical protein